MIISNVIDILKQIQISDTANAQKKLEFSVLGLADVLGIREILGLTFLGNEYILKRFR